ncbi:MAG: PHB depolymerase family esterase [Fibrobacteria bacterium]
MLNLKILKCPIGKMLLVAGFMSIPVFSQTTQQIARFEARTFTATNSVTLPYRLFIPVNYNAAIRYPLMTALHGNGERGSDNTRQFSLNVAKQWIADSVQARVPHFILAPHTAVGWTDLAQRTVVMEIIAALKKEFSLDTTRFYISGLSAGAMGTWNLIKDYPTVFAAAVPCSGSLFGNNNVTTIVRTPFWAFHGDADETVNVSGTRDIVTAVEKLGYPVVRYISSQYRVNPTVVSNDSLAKAVKGGANFLYSEIIGGNHFAGWNEGWAHPLIPGWVFSKTKPASTTGIVLTPKNSHHRAFSSTDLFFFSLDGKRIDSRPGVSIRNMPVLLVERP